MLVRENIQFKGHIFAGGGCTESMGGGHKILVPSFGADLKISGGDHRLLFRVLMFFGNRGDHKISKFYNYPMGVVGSLVPPPKVNDVSPK